MDKLMSAYRNAKQKLEELYKTEQYQKNCQYFTSERDRLVEMAEQRLSQIDRYKSDIEAAIVRTEYASGCKYLHRGYYCPSLLQDAVVDNVRRGNLRKQITARTKTYWEYGFNAEGQLICSESIVTKTVAGEAYQLVTTREFLFYEESRIYGITLRKDGTVEAITEEVLQDGKCISYTHCLCTSYEGVISCGEICSEYYDHRAEKLQAQWHSLNIPLQENIEFSKKMGWEPMTIPIYRKNRFLLEKKDGKYVLTENNER